MERHCTKQTKLHLWNHIFLGTQFIIILVFVFLNLSICHSHQHRSQMISPLIESAPWSVSAGQMWGASDCKYSIVNKIINKILRRINREMARYWSRVTWSPGRGPHPTSAGLIARVPQWWHRCTFTFHIHIDNIHREGTFHFWKCLLVLSYFKNWLRASVYMPRSQYNVK